VTMEDSRDGDVAQKATDNKIEIGMFNLSCSFVCLHCL